MTKQAVEKMTVPCPVCNRRIPVPDVAILDEVKRTPALRKKVASLLGTMTGGNTKLDAEGRRQRALKAVQAREANKKKEKR